MDCDDLGFPNQWELPAGIRSAPDRAWASQAACADKPQHWWFPDTGERTPEVREALAICAGCPVRERCLEHALEQNESHGIWGGTSERERQRIRRATRGAA